MMLVLWRAGPLLVYASRFLSLLLSIAPAVPYPSSPACDWNGTATAQEHLHHSPKSPTYHMSEPMGQRSVRSRTFAAYAPECLGHTTSQWAYCEGRRRLGGKACASRLLAWMGKHPTDTDTLARRVCGGGSGNHPDGTGSPARPWWEIVSVGSGRHVRTAFPWRLGAAGCGRGDQRK